MNFYRLMYAVILYICIYIYIHAHVEKACFFCYFFFPPRLSFYPGCHWDVPGCQWSCVGLSFVKVKGLRIVRSRSKVRYIPTIYGCFLKWWYPTTMGSPTKNDHFGVFWGYHHLRKNPYIPSLGTCFVCN